MKLLTVLAALALLAAPAHADTWAWVPIRDSATLDAHLAQCDHAQPNLLPVFETIAALVSAPTLRDAGRTTMDEGA